MGKSNTLIITNGSVAASLLKINKAADVYLSWDDILHEGPVPNCDSLNELTAIRSRFLEDRYQVRDRSTANGLEKRNDLISRHHEFDRIELWFEHDLFDQLQLIQILDFFADTDLSVGKLFLIQADDYLGMQTPEDIMGFHKLCALVTQAQLDTAQVAWRAFGEPTPQGWAALLNEDLDALPWLAGAVARMLEELPSARTGLSRTELEFLSKIAGKNWNARKCVGMFLGTQAEPWFIGDWTLFNLLNEFMKAEETLIQPLKGMWTARNADERDQFMKSKVVLTPLAHDLIAGNADQTAVNGIDRWWGGTHLTTDNCWRWDSSAGKLVAPFPLDA